MPKAKRVYKRLLVLGWKLERQRGSHKILKKGTYTLVFAYHDSVDLGSIQLSQIAKQAGCSLEDLL